jgi:hypothetical protein
MTTRETHTDPAERRALMRLFYSGWRPTRLGRWVNRSMAWWSGLGLPPRLQAALEVRGRASGRWRSIPVVIASMDGKRYLVSMLGPQSEWARNVEAAHGDAVIRQGRRQPVHLVPVLGAERAPILREYVRIARSGRTHFPLSVGAPLSEFEAIADRYPVYRIDPAGSDSTPQPSCALPEGGGRVTDRRRAVTADEARGHEPRARSMPCARPGSLLCREGEQR